MIIQALRLFSVIFLLYSPAYAGEDALVNAVKFANQSMAEIPQSLTESCSQQSLERACPQVLQKSFQEIYRKGTAGTINAIISDAKGINKLFEGGRK